MKKVLIAYFSQTGNTEKMAGYIAEGVRFNGQEAVTREITEIKSTADIQKYDGYILGSPTYNQSLPGPMKQCLSLFRQINLENKLAGSFSTYTHDVGYTAGGQAAEILLETMQNEFKMIPFDLGPLKLREADLETGDGMHTCQDYGKVFSQKLAG